MRKRELLREAAASARAQPVPSILVAVLAAMMCCSSLLTVGRTASAERQLSERLDAAGSRVLVLSDTRRQGLLPPGVLAAVAGLSTVERAVGLSAPQDVVNGLVVDGGQRLPGWTVLGDSASAVELTGGRWPGPGEAIVAEPALGRLGLDGAYGYVSASTTDYAVVGTYRAEPPFEELDGGAVLGAADASEPAAASLHVVVAGAPAVARTQAEVLRIVAGSPSAGLEVTSPASLAALQQLVEADVGRFSRSLLLFVLLAGGGLTAVVVAADTLVRRSDLGRRRALGATRAVVVGLVLGRTALAAAAGAVIGTAVGAAAAAGMQALAPPDFLAGTAFLSLLAATAAATPPALWAASRDPVRVLRTP